MNVPIRVLALSAVIAAAIGCGGGSSSTPAAPSPEMTSTSTAPVSYTPPNVPAGLPVEQSKDDKTYKTLVASSSRFGHRGDPFELTREEAAYDRQQNVERVMGTMGGFTTQYELPPDETKQIPVDEPQPYRRLAGIIVGDSVLAIIDMGTGQAATIIRPGMKVPKTEWTVASIDEDKAVLHRDGPVGPHNITVRLESPPPGFSGNTGGAPTGGMPPQGAGGNRKKQMTPGFGM